MPLFRFAAIALLAATACNRGDDVRPPIPGGPQILFGDLHVHSTNSVDVFAMRMPFLGGEGAVKPIDHCDFARYCSQLDFWAITDHQEGAPPDAWEQSREAVGVCNALHGGNGVDPALVSFAGFEWQQSSQVPEEDWGHKNVIFRGEAPLHAFASVSQVTGASAEEMELAAELAKLADPENAAMYDEVAEYALAGLEAPACDEATASPELPEDCVEYAADPATVYDKLDEWGLEAVVIPHGTTWAAHHPPDFSWRHQLDAVQHSTRYQTLLEMYSGHGSMEEYREWRAVDVDVDGNRTCAEATADYLPCCWRAGELVRDRCDDPDSEECEAEVVAARQAFVDAGRDGFDVVPDAEPEDWLDCGQCRDCFQPAEGHRPLGSAQAGMAMTAFDDDGNPIRYRFGFVGSTDTPAVGPGTGYKEFREMSDLYGSADPSYDGFVDLMMPQLFPDWKRQNSFYYSGGLVAVHAEDRSRDAIWEALDGRRVYATTGERILLWFDLVNAPESAAMGSLVTMSEAPEFEVRAVGSFKQAEGCPEPVRDAAPDDLVDGSCFGQCYNPTDERYLIDRIEVVRITPQVSVDEPLDGLIDDPLAVLDCPPDPNGCKVTFEDPDWQTLGRVATYYVRAIQETTPQLNADNLRCERDEDGACVSTEPCAGGYQGVGDDCLAEDQERAWASPITVVPP